jgi:hypothetical protein
VIGSDKTSADYYFDSYSHFGTAPAPLDFAKMLFILPQIWMLFLLICIGKKFES